MLEQLQSSNGAGRPPVNRPERRWRISGTDLCHAPQTRREPPGDGVPAQLFTRYEIWSTRGDEADGDGGGGDDGGGHAAERTLWVLPGEARLVAVEAGGRLSAVIGNRRYDALPPVVLFGPTSRPTRLVANEGAVVAIGLSALGWAGVVRRSAVGLGNKAVAADDVVDRHLVASLTAAVAAGCGKGVAQRLDDALGTLPPSLCPDEPLVIGLTEIIAKGGIRMASAVCEQLKTPAHVVRRSALRHFGYPPKVLLNRRRFVCALERIILADGGYGDTAQHGYFDASHFIRDARRFLGMTPKRFLALAG